MLMLLSAPAWAQADDEAQAWLLTYGPGEVYWQRYGHNAIWIRDPSLGLDHTFNFGFFDFTQDNFLANFIKGRLNYFAAARPAQIELAEYIDEDRTIRAQRLDLDPEAFARLRDHLLDQISAANREYLYDYYLHNCSTRLRDALDIALNGQLRSDLENTPAFLDYREHTRRLTQMDWPYYLGLQTGLGSPIDGPISLWGESFIPGVLADVVEGYTDPGSGRPLVAEEIYLHESDLPPPGDEPTTAWLRYLLLSLAVLFAAWVACVIPGITARRLAVAWFVVAGLLGAVLTYLWLGTDHWVSGMNLNLLLLNPLWLLVALVPALREPGIWVIVVAGLMAIVAQWLPQGQYTADVISFVLPLNLVAGATFFFSGAKLRE